MRLSLRFVVPLLAILAAIAYAVLPLVDGLALRWFVRDLNVRSQLIANALEQPLIDSLAKDSRKHTTAYLTRIITDERLYALALCLPDGSSVVATKTFPESIRCDDLDRFDLPLQRLLDTPQGLLHVAVEPLKRDGQQLGELVLVHDMSFVQRRSAETRRYLYAFFVALGLVVSLITVVIAQLSWRGWVQGTRALLRGEGLVRPSERGALPELRMIERDLRELMRDLRTEYRSRDPAQTDWSPDTLRDILRRDLRGEDIIAVSNREPYIHVRRNDEIEVVRPASGLVTALEPIMRACSGTWIAHGSGDADREVVDANDRVAVPPEHAAYRIRRIWLTPEEEQGYYFGFANEGLWPLCHIAHVRPAFRAGDWRAYVEVNQRFAQAVVDESRDASPIVLVQDYHCALVPRMIREQLPDATIITFWHIPWPNPESFAICPWRAELLDGLLGSSILGFHTRFHCNNFVDTVDRLLEARVDRETLDVTYGGLCTAVKRYPISIEWPPPPETTLKTVEECRSDIRRRYRLPADLKVGIGVDRLDYTKGILERFMAVERLLDLHSEWVGKFALIQIAAPSRSSILQYQSFEVEVRALASRINARFARGGVPPIVLRIAHHGPAEVYEHYRGADLCFVSSLHDGMNLVAKEFIACRDDDQGVLILSQFTGAARELPEALIVNPYDNEQCATALHLALTMPPKEQQQRMRLMRGLVQQFNVFRWAGRMLLDAAGMRARVYLGDKPGLPPRRAMSDARV